MRTSQSGARVDSCRLGFLDVRLSRCFERDEDVGQAVGRRVLVMAGRDGARADSRSSAECQGVLRLNKRGGKGARGEDKGDNVERRDHCWLNEKWNGWTESKGEGRRGREKAEE